jgi:hypothetical protein
MAKRISTPAEKKEKANRLAELAKVNKKLKAEIKEKAKRADELKIAIVEKAKRAEELRISLEKYNTLIEATEMGYATVDLKGTILDANAIYVKLTGYSRLKQIIGRNISEWVADHDKKRVAEAMGKCYKNKKIKNFELDYVTKAGVIIPVEFNATVFKSNPSALILTFSQAIASRKDALKRLKESEDKFKNIFDYTTVGVSLVALDGRWLDVNQAFCKITGYSRKELLSKKFNDITYPGDKSHGLEAVRDILVGKINDAHFEKRYIHKNRHIVWVSLNIALVRRVDGAPLYFVTNAENITERKRLELELKKEKEDVYITVEERTRELKKQKLFLSSIVENIPDMIFVKDSKNLKFQLLNTAGEKLLGQKRKDMIGKSDYDFFPIAEADFFVAKDREVLGDKKMLDIPEESIETKNGSRILHTKKIPLYDEAGRPEFLLGISEDITERKKLEEELKGYTEGRLKESETRFRAIYENSPVSIFLVSLDGHFIAVNPASEKMLGYTEAELKQLTFTDITHPDDKLRDLAKLKEMLAGKSNTYRVEKRYLRKDKQVVFTRIDATVIKENSKPAFFLTIAENITEEKKLDQAKTDFLSIVSHQLRTPLSATKWVLEALTKDSSLTPKQKERADDLVASNERLIALVNDLLDVAKIESGKLTVKREKTDLRKLIGEVASSFEEISLNKRKVIKVVIPDEIKYIDCDPVLISEVLENLLSNAINYSIPASSEINLVVSERSDDYLVAIHNEGVFDRPSTGSSVFDKFVRGSKSSEQQTSGSGLGLYISKRAIEANGGKIWLESDPKSGTTFYFTMIKSKIE